jgi:chromosome segregation ATPase
MANPDPDSASALKISALTEQNTTLHLNVDSLQQQLTKINEEYEELESWASHLTENSRQTDLENEKLKQSISNLHEIINSKKTKYNRLSSDHEKLREFSVNSSYSPGMSNKGFLLTPLKGPTSVVSNRNSVYGKGGSMVTSGKDTEGGDSADQMEEIFLVGEENNELRMELHEIQEKDYETRQELGVVAERLEQSNNTLQQSVLQSESLKHDRNKLRNDLDQIQTKYKRSATQRNKLTNDLEMMSELLEERNEEISALGKKISDRDAKIEIFENL